MSDPTGAYPSSGPELSTASSERSVTRSVEYGGGYWHWFCMRGDCRWSGMSLPSEGSANREADRHDAEYHA